MGERAWHSFLRDSLQGDGVHNVILKYEGLDDIPISACTLANAAFIDEQIKAGAKRVAIAVCDYSREALAYSLGLSINDALCGVNQIDYSTDAWSKGDTVSFCGFNVEFKGFTVDPHFGKSIIFSDGKNNSKTTRGLNYIPGRIQKCWEGATPTRKRGKKFQDAINAYNELSLNGQSLHDAISTVKQPLIFASSHSSFLNVPPTRLSKATVAVDGELFSAQQCIKIAHISTKGTIKEYCDYELGGHPSVVSICRNEEGVADLFYALDYIEEGNSPRAVVVESPEPETLDDMSGYLEDILENEVPVIVFCSERTMRNADSLTQLGFKKLLWTREALLSLESASLQTPWKLTPREACYAHRAVRIQPVLNSANLPFIAKTLFQINSYRATMSDKGQQASMTIMRLFNNVLKQTEASTEEIAEGRIRQLETSLEILSNPSYDSSLSFDDLNALSKAGDSLRKALQANSPLPKEDVAYHAIRDSLERGRKACLISSNPLSANDSEKYWRDLFAEESFDPSSIRALTPREFMKQECTPEDEDVFISGWFNRETMEKIVESGLSGVYSVLLYKGKETELETNWYLSASNYWKDNRSSLKENTLRTLAAIGVDGKEIFKTVSSARSGPNKTKDTSTSKMVELMEEERAAKESPRDCEASDLARAVYFADGRHKWLHVPDSTTHLGGDTLIVIERLSSKELGYTRKTANALHQGDIVLKIESDNIALDKQCEKSSGAYEETLKVAKSWRKPIDEARKTMSDQFIKEKILLAGSKKTDQTIMSWIRGDIAIAPSKKDISIINKAFNGFFTDKEVSRIASSARIVKGNRIISGKSISTSIAGTFIEDAMNSSIEKAASEFSLKHDLGTIELLVVDYVGKPQMVSVTRFGFYID